MSTTNTLKSTISEFLDVLNKIEENEGEVNESLLPVLDLKESAVMQKVDSYVNFIECVQAQLTQQQDLKKKIDQNIKTLKSLEDKLKDNAKFLMESNDLLELNGSTRKMKLQNAGGQQKLIIQDDMFFTEKCINERYLGYFPLDSYQKKTVFVIDDSAFKTLVREQFVYGCYFEERKKCLKLS